MSKYINLHANTEYSLLESTIKIDSLIEYAKNNELSSLAITDHNVMYGVAEFVKKCQKNNIKPIIGLDLDVQDFRLILLAKNHDGYLDLMKLSSKKVRGEEIRVEDIPVKDLFIIDHPTKGNYAINGNELEIHNYFVGLQHGEHVNGVAVIDSKIMNKNENKALSTLNYIKESKQKEFNEEEYTCRPKNISNDAIKQAIKIAELCNVKFPKVKSVLPEFPTPNKISASEYLKQIIKENIQDRLKDNVKEQEYLTRIKYEVGIIESLGFSDYFLIIWDLIKWSKEQGISVGPGRGSAAGSLVSYILGITDIDPIKFELLFERFLNPERVTMPDIDIDIQDSRRDEVVEYMFNKYGANRTALIITFSRLGAKMALRDSARSMGILPREVDVLSKMIGLGETLTSTYEKVASFRAHIDRDERMQELFKTAKSIEGLPRNHGTHAAGVVLSSEEIHDLVPTIQGINNYNQTQYSMDYMESNGLLKIDILGLRNLTIIQDIQKEVFNNYQRNLVLEKIKLNDKLTNELLSNIDTNGIFQLESYGMKNTLASVGVAGIHDITAILSLYRPGPMEFIKTYAKRKKGEEKVPSISKEFDMITKRTYGIIVYQEQIMQIAQEFAGMSFGQADVLRRAIGKKKIDLIQGLKNTFVNGALSKGQKPEQIEKVYKTIESFASYGFNKSHAVAYAVISYRMAFLKARFPLEFYTSLLNASLDSQKSVMNYVNEAKRKGIEVVAPDINLSEEKVYNKLKKIYMPLRLIKGFGSVASKKLLDERIANGRFKDFFDFVARVKLAKLGDSLIQTLIASNALREFGHMQSLLDTLPSAIRYADMITIKKEKEKILDFNLISKPKTIKSERNIKAEIISENKYLGFNYNVFFTDPYVTEQKIVDLENEEIVEVAIYVDRIYKKRDKNGKSFAVVLAHDSTNKIEFTVFNRIWEFIKNNEPKNVYIARIKSKMFNDKKSYILEKPWKETHE
ncbi:DNA polymerase III subunit alpha [Mycoplasma marinum]|uniref:DNA-directed DNA polymerase n=1 Tax=Mycoplasma marinum TaxID=1937190 RepID=A0A4R0XKQ2_9MOLU|nr:DNA polymerase III subunit alpha [Mycoplasma marinum]TCG11236.1 DNA polymerase III subunit alpha [Mycoplasma marinum]